MTSNPIEVSVSLADFTESALILPELKGQDPAAVIQELSQTLQRTSRVPDLLPFYLAVLNREFLISTALDYGIALPHARLTGLKELCFAVGRTRRPIHWGNNGAMTVRLIFLLAVPSTEAAEYLLLMAGLGRLGKDTAALRGLLEASDGEEMLTVLRQVKLRQCRGVSA
jgi:mannitol/fructose-specific phosphotransferase system IIA component (Ntr-type)